MGIQTPKIITQQSKVSTSLPILQEARVYTNDKLPNGTHHIIICDDEDIPFCPPPPADSERELDYR